MSDPIQKDPAPEIPLRARPRPVTRLNRRTLVIGASLAALVVLIATLWVFTPHPVERTKDAVVNISAEKLVSQRVSPFGPNLFWEGMPYQTITRKATSLGSGLKIGQFSPCHRFGTRRVANSATTMKCRRR